MRALAAIVACAGIVLGLAAPARAATDRGKFQNFLGKILGKPGDKAKVACVCFDSGNDSSGGWLVQRVVNDRVTIECRVPIHDNAGEHIDTEPCSNFLPVGK